MIPLRPYQQRDVERIRAAFGSGRKRIIYVAPTGSGKTVCFCYLAVAAAEKFRARAQSPDGGGTR